MTTLSAEVAYDSALTQQLLKKPRTLGDYMEIEKQLRAATAEIERLTACLQKANANHEHFEREWYLRGDEIERLRAELEHIRLELAQSEERADAVSTELLRARTEIESWKRQSRANWEAARALATTATGYPRALSEHEQAAMDTLKESP